MAITIQEATDEYKLALKQGQKEYKDLLARGKNPSPKVLTDIIGEQASDMSQYVGLVEIPTERIIGTKTAGRISAFTANFNPLLEPKSEFATKWIRLCAAHLSDEGIRDPIVCYEYLGNFYVQEGNKRVSVLRHYGAARIPGIVHRIMPPVSDDPRIKAYHEFLDWYKLTGIYDVQFSQPGGYAKLTKAIGLAPGQVWTETNRRRFRAYFQYFRDAFFALGGADLFVQPEDALLLWLELYPYSDLGSCTPVALKKTLELMWDNLIAISTPDPVVRTEPPAEAKQGLFSKIIRPDYLSVAFIHQSDAETSSWTHAHETGRKYLESALGDQVVTHCYFHADTPELTEELMEHAIEAGADVIFATTPQMIVPSLKISIEHPKVKVLNCSVHMPYSTVRTYYSRIYEGKFITGAIAGAMADDNRIGYVGSYPIHGVPAAINAFALGVQMTNPRAVIDLKWSCMEGNPTEEFLASGIRVISNRDTPVEDQICTEYGTYIYGDNDQVIPLGSPVWIWGKFYEHVVRSILDGSWETDKTGQAVNYWWGMSSDVIDVTLSDQLPEGVRYMANLLRDGMRLGAIDPFDRRIVAQNGTVINDGTKQLSPDDLLHCDWLCDNIHGTFPTYDEILPISRSMVKVLGIYSEEEINEDEVVKP